MSYSASFTAGGLLFNEFESVLSFVQKDDFNEFILQEAKNNNYLKIKTEAARKRVVTEIKKRVEVVSPNFWEYYKSSSENEKKILLFYVCCKSYQLVWDFHFKVTIPGFWAYRHEVDIYAYKMYLDELSSKDETINSWSDSTRKKCITNYIRMLTEAGIIIGKKIQRPEVGHSFYCFFCEKQ